MHLRTPGHFDHGFSLKRVALNSGATILPFPRVTPVRARPTLS